MTMEQQEGIVLTLFQYGIFHVTAIMLSIKKKPGIGGENIFLVPQVLDSIFLRV